MKNISEYLTTINESANEEINFCIMNCGSMSMYKDDLVKVIKAVKGKVNVYTFDPDGIKPVPNIEDFKFSGPHTEDFDDVINTIKDSLGELSFIVTC